MPEITDETGSSSAERLWFDQQLMGVPSQGASKSLQSPESGALLSTLQSDQRNPPNVRGPGQRFLSQPGGLSEPADSFPKGLPPHCGYDFNGWPIRCVAIVPGEVPRKLDSLAASRFQNHFVWVGQFQARYPFAFHDNGNIGVRD